jgi:copper(I)-binding protein
MLRRHAIFAAMTIMRFLLPAGIATVLTLASAISFVRAAEVALGTLRITSAWARATSPGASVGAAYAMIENRGEADDRLLSAATPAARAVELHQTIEENGMAKMRPLEDAVAPACRRAGDAARWYPYDACRLAAPLKAGETVPVTLRFETAGAVTVDLIVAPIGADGPPEAHHAH